MNWKEKFYMQVETKLLQLPKKVANTLLETMMREIIGLEKILLFLQSFPIDKLWLWQVDF